jgi:uncharacterized membrane protein
VVGPRRRGSLVSAWLRRHLVWLRESLWVLPALMTLLSVALALATIELDSRLVANGQVRKMWFVFGVGADGVRGVLSAIASSIITVTGVVFSITIVALQLASTQFTPRVLRTFMEDRANHLVLGTFIGTFTYALLILRFVRGGSERLGAFVPSISVSVAMVLTLASIGCLIYFVDHSAQSIRASTIIERLVDEAAATARHVFPHEIGEPVEASSIDCSVPDGTPLAIRAPHRGYLQLLDEDALLGLSDFGALTLRAEGRVGDFFRTGDVLASVWCGRGASTDALAARVRAAFVLGIEPTGTQDVALGIARLTDIAAKALSPGINDPSTAVACIDGLSEVLVIVGTRQTPPPVRIAKNGLVRLIARRPEYGELVDLAFAQIRHYGAGTPIIATKLLEMAAAAGARLPLPRREPLLRNARHVARAADEAIVDEEVRARMRIVADRTIARLAGAASEATS